jgi:holin-like protein
MAILIAFYMAGWLLRAVFHFPLPANVIGLILFLVFLFAGWVKLERVEQTAQFLLTHMMLFFAPFIVGTIVYLRVIGENGIGIGLSLFAGTLIVMAVTAKVVEALYRKGEQQDGTNGIVE